MMFDHLCNLISTHRVQGLSDGQLLQRFVAHHDEAAFAALMQRHGRLVLSVCRHILPHEPDVEDAFQGTFLVLARKAASIRASQAIPSWLHRTAYRISLRAKMAAIKRRERERQVARPEAIKGPFDTAWRELQCMLNRELDRLPDKYRAPFVLCCLEGKSKPEAAEALGWKEGTVSSRLAQARERLRKRLARCGVELSAVLVGTAVASENATAGAVPGALTARTIEAALRFAAHRNLPPALVSRGAVALAEGFLRALVARGLKLVLAPLLLLTLVAGAAGALFSPSRQDDPGQSRESGPAAPDPAPRPAPAPEQAGGQEEAFTGTVLGPDGQPLAGADVTLVGVLRPQLAVPETVAQARQKVLGTGTSNAEGKFRLTVARATLARYHGLKLVTGGQGQTWRQLLSEAGQQDIRLQVESGQVFRGRLVDTRGVPARGVAVQVASLEKKGPPRQSINLPVPPEPLPPWLAPVTTDERGEFVLRGLAPDCEVHLQVRSPRFAPQWLIVNIGHTEPARPVTLTLEPLRTLEGQITCKDTGQPLAFARVLVLSQWARTHALESKVEATTDEQGRFRLSPFPGQLLVLTAFPPARAPYLILQYARDWSKRTSREQIDLALPRGVPLHGRVTEAVSGGLVAGAYVDYLPRAANPALRKPNNETTLAFWRLTASSSADGSFQMVVPPGPGSLRVKGPSVDFVHVETSALQLALGQPGGLTHFPDGLVKLDFKPGPETRQVPITLRRGVTVRGRVVAQDGQPVARALLLTPTYLPNGFEFQGETLPVRDGRFQIPGCDPDRRITVACFDVSRRQGALSEVSARPDGGEPVIRLAPCGSLTVRFVDQDGKPFDRPSVVLDLVLRSGASLRESVLKKVPARVAVAVSNGFSSFPTPVGPRGTITFANLIPGATYVLQAYEGAALLDKQTVTVGPGQNLKLADITILRPANQTRRR